MIARVDRIEIRVDAPTMIVGNSRTLRPHTHRAQEILSPEAEMIDMIAIVSMVMAEVVIIAVEVGAVVVTDTVMAAADIVAMAQVVATVEVTEEEETDMVVTAEAVIVAATPTEVEVPDMAEVAVKDIMVADNVKGLMIDGVDLADLVELLDLADRRTMQVPEKDLWMMAEQKDLQWIHQIIPANDTRVMEPVRLVAEHVERDLPAIRKEKEEIAMRS